jgi:hypothetical protein
MKVTFEGTPEEIKNVLQAIGDKEHASTEIRHRTAKSEVASHLIIDGVSLAHALTGQLDSLRGQGVRRDRGQR